MKQQYEKFLTVGAEDLDALDHVNNVRYLEWVQDISRAHWEQLTNSQWDAHYIWVVRSHHITYHRSARLGETLRLTTYVPRAAGAISHRKVDIRLDGGMDMVAECLTEWVLLDALSGRPVRIPEEIRAVFA